MKITVKQLNKTFDIKPTNEVIRKVYQFQLDSAKLSSDASQNTVKMFESGIKCRLRRSSRFAGIGRQCHNAILYD